MLVLQVLNFDGFYSTNSSNLQVLLQSKMSRITKRSLSKSNDTNSSIDNGGIKVDLLTPLERLDPNKKSHIKQHSRRSEKRGIVGVRPKIIPHHKMCHSFAGNRKCDTFSGVIALLQTTTRFHFQRPHRGFR